MSDRKNSSKQNKKENTGLRKLGYTLMARNAEKSTRIRYLLFNYASKLMTEMKINI